MGGRRHAPRESDERTARRNSLFAIRYSLFTTHHRANCGHRAHFRGLNRPCRILHNGGGQRRAFDVRLG
jgi:hypothetical protein